MNKRIKQIILQYAEVSVNPYTTGKTSSQIKPFHLLNISRNCIPLKEVLNINSMTKCHKMSYNINNCNIRSVIIVLIVIIIG